MENDQAKEAVENTEQNEMNEARKIASEKELDIAEARIRHATQLRFFLSVVIGVPLGYAVSYMFQSERLHAVVSFENYFRYFYYVLYPQTTGSGFATSILGNFHYVAWGGIIVVGMLFHLLGSMAVSSARAAAKAVMSDVEAEEVTKRYSSHISFGRLKPEEMGIGHSIWRIIKMLLIVLLSIIGLVIVTIVIPHM